MAEKDMLHNEDAGSNPLAQAKRVGDDEESEENTSANVACEAGVKSRLYSSQSNKLF